MKKSIYCLILLSLLSIGCATGPPPTMEQLNRLRSKFLALEAGRSQASGQEGTTVDQEIKALLKRIEDMEKRLGVPHMSGAPDR